ncbi:MAG: hypothetical protein FWD96_05495 [Defluviitaleaceae bacterium]|nr:hypothetical protein [Defluviitaleaceae bacterium]
MKKIAFEDFERIMTQYHATKQGCIEVYFCVDDSFVYNSSWLGKQLDQDTEKAIYWFGLIEDGSQAYDFDSFEEFANAKVFSGKSLKEIWESISLVFLGDNK